MFVFVPFEAKFVLSVKFSNGLFDFSLRRKLSLIYRQTTKHFPLNKNRESICLLNYELSGNHDSINQVWKNQMNCFEMSTKTKKLKRKLEKLCSLILVGKYRTEKKPKEDLNLAVVCLSNEFNSNLRQIKSTRRTLLAINKSEVVD